MSRQHARSGGAGLGRRAALRAGALVAAAIGALATGPARAAAPAGQRRERREVDVTPLNTVSSALAGGAPTRGDWFYQDGPAYAREEAGGEQIGTYHAFGAWTNDPADSSAPYQRLATVQYRLFATGSIFGMINEGGSNPADLEGIVQGGTGRFEGARGVFRQSILSPGPPPVMRTEFELVLPDD
jgi:hypothetical protein